VTPPQTLREWVIEVPADREDVVTAEVYALGVQGVEVRDAETGGAPPGRVRIVAWLPPDQEIPSFEGAIVSSRVVTADWQTEDEPALLGERFAVVAPGGVAPSGREALVLDAHLAFGDGHHPSTALCVAMLEGLPIPRDVLDVGTGTGILAIVAAKLGGRRVVACDVDPLALHAARRHVADNGVADVVTVVDTMPDGRFDLVMANLPFPVLIPLLPALAARARGTVLVAGFTEDARPAVETAAAAAGLTVSALACRDGWASLELRLA
jgi:ribosomal protein L11 methyltransferase